MSILLKGFKNNHIQSGNELVGKRTEKWLVDMLSNGPCIGIKHRDRLLKELI